jgi:hypothetical protein
MKSLCGYALILFLATIGYSDGIPVDRKTGKITVPFTAIKLTESQTEEIEALGTLTLSNIEWKDFRKIGINCPKRFNAVVPNTYQDCTCDLSPYVIQISKDSVAILHGEITGNAGRDLLFFLEYDQKWISLSVDHRGQFYFNGTLIPFDSLISTISNAKILHKSDTSKYNIDFKRGLFVNKPFGMTFDSPQLKSRINKLYETAKRKGLSIPTE